MAKQKMIASEAIVDISGRRYRARIRYSGICLYGRAGSYASRRIRVYPVRHEQARLIWKMVMLV